MAQYLDIPIETDPDTLKQEVIDTLQEHFPEWEPADGNLETWIIDAFTRGVSDLRELAADVPTAIFKQYGETIAGVPVNSATSATGETKWVMQDTAGYKIDAGTEVAIRVDGELRGFVLLTDLVIAGGDDTAEGVLVEATEPGSESNSLEGAMLVISSVLGEPVVTLEGPTSGGEDEETDEEYLNRLVEELQILSPTPILPSDFEVIAKRRPEVGRALALNLYNPSNGLFTNERYVTVVPIDADGEALTAKVKEEIEEEFDELREVNFVVPVVDPDYTKVDVEVVVTAYEKYDLVALKEQIEQALTSYFDPSRWGQPLFGEAGEWVRQDKVHLSKIEVAVGMVQGVDFISLLKIAKHGEARKAEDLALTGAAPLTRVGDLFVTVEEP